METYLQDFKKENRELEKTLAHVNQNTDTADNRKNKNIQHSKQDDTLETDYISDQRELSLEAQVIQLHNKGNSIEEKA